MIHRTPGAVLALAPLLLLSACDDRAGDPSAQYGANPKLPDPHQYLVPPMKVMAASGWAAGEAPTVPAGLRIQALGTGFLHPRIVYGLPNGDVLVVESNGPKAPVYRPKDFIEGKIKGLAGTGAPGGQRISLLRDRDGDGIAETRSVLIDHLNAPYGVVLVGNDLYVADTDAILKFPYAPGATQITDPGVKLTDLPVVSQFEI